MSSLLFCPSDSLIRKEFRKEEPTWVSPKPVVERSWNTCIQILEGHGNTVNSVAFSHDGTNVVSGSYDKTVRVWQVKTGECVRTLEGHGHSVNSVAFSRDSTHVVLGSYDKTVRV